MHAATELWRLGIVDWPKVKQDLTTGIETLVQIRPLVDAGAIRIAPRTFLGLLPDVQEMAKRGQ